MSDKRWCTIEETARHAGHANTVRESISGDTVDVLLAAAEGWPCTAWGLPGPSPTSSFKELRRRRTEKELL
jgi:hypothetical protein